MSQLEERSISGNKKSSIQFTGGPAWGKCCLPCHVVSGLDPSPCTQIMAVIGLSPFLLFAELEANREGTFPFWTGAGIRIKPKSDLGGFCSRVMTTKSSHHSAKNARTRQIPKDIRKMLDIGGNGQERDVDIICECQNHEYRARLFQERVPKGL